MMNFMSIALQNTELSEKELRQLLPMYLRNEDLAVSVVATGV